MVKVNIKGKRKGREKRIAMRRGADDRSVPAGRLLSVRLGLSVQFG